MDPFTLIGGALGAAGSIAGGIMGADASDEAAKYNYAVNLMNYYQRESERFQAIQEARRREHDAKLGYTNARGDSTSFVPGRGWVSTLSAASKAMQDAQDREQFRVLNQDLPAKREQMFKNLRDQDQDRYLAEGALDAYKREGELPEYAAARNRTLAQSGTSQQWENITNAIMRQNVRSGASNTGRVLADLMSQRAKDAASVGANAYASGQQAGQQADNARRGQFMNLFTTLGARARGMPQVTYRPMDMDSNINSLLTKGQDDAQHSGDAVINATGKQGGTLDYMQPNMGWAAAVSGAGQSLGSLFGNIGSSFERRQAMGNTGFSGRYGSGTSELY